MDFIESELDVEYESYELVSHFPKMIYSDEKQTLEAAQLFPRASLFVQVKTD